MNHKNREKDHMYENIVQNMGSKYQKIGNLAFVVGVMLSTFGEFELIAILFKLLPIGMLKFIPGHTALFSAVFYLILGNFTILIEYQFRKNNSKMQIFDQPIK